MCLRFIAFLSAASHHRFSKCNEKAFAASSFIRFTSSACLVKLPGVLCRFKGQQKCNTIAASSLSVVTQQLSMLEKLCSFCCSVPEVCSLSFETAACESLNYCVLFLDWHGLKDKSVHLLRMLFLRLWIPKAEIQDTAASAAWHEWHWCIDERAKKQLFIMSLLSY